MLTRLGNYGQSADSEKRKTEMSTDDVIEEGLTKILNQMSELSSKAQEIKSSAQTLLDEIEKNKSKKGGV